MGMAGGSRCKKLLFVYFGNYWEIFNFDGYYSFLPFFCKGIFGLFRVIYGAKNALFSHIPKNPKNFIHSKTAFFEEKRVVIATNY